MKLLAFAASNSKKSINKKLVTYASSLLEGAEVEILDLNDYELPVFSVDTEEELGNPALAKEFLSKILSSDAVIISFAEHNGSYTAAYKSLFDWCSRITRNVFQDKPLVLLSTSPGARGGASVLAAASTSAASFGGIVRATLSIPGFNENFDFDRGIPKNQTTITRLTQAVNSLKSGPITEY